MASPVIPRHPPSSRHCKELAVSRKAGAEQRIDVDGIDVLICWKKVRNITLRVKPPDGHVEVSAPFRESEEFIAGVVRERRAWINKHAQQVRGSVSARAENASPEEIAQWRAWTEARVPTLVAKWEPALGVKAGVLAYRNMKSRWGSCQPATGRICINVRLALYPPECLEYVVVHELCHLLVSGHGPAFYALLDEHLPNWRAARALLR